MLCQAARVDCLPRMARPLAKCLVQAQRDSSSTMAA